MSSSIRALHVLCALNARQARCEPSVSLCQTYTGNVRHSNHLHAVLNQAQLCLQTGQQQKAALASKQAQVEATQIAFSQQIDFMPAKRK